MAIPTFPTLPGLAFPVKKTPTYQSIIHKAVAGQSTAQAPQPFATYSYELPFEFLRADNVNLELQTLLSFFRACAGQVNPFHFFDPDDNSATGQTLGVGDGVTTQFPLLVSSIFDIDPIQDAIAAGMAVRVNGVSAPFTTVTTAQYGTIYAVNVTTVPPVGQLVVADFTYNRLCRFDQDTIDFSKFGKFSAANDAWLWEAKSVKFSSVLQ